MSLRNTLWLALAVCSLGFGIHSMIAWKQNYFNHGFRMASAIHAHEDQEIFANDFPRLLFYEKEDAFSADPVFKKGNVVVIDLGSAQVREWSRDRTSFKVQTDDFGSGKHYETGQVYIFHTDRPIATNRKSTLFGVTGYRAEESKAHTYREDGVVRYMLIQVYDLEVLE